MDKNKNKYKFICFGSKGYNLTPMKDYCDKIEKYYKENKNLYKNGDEINSSALWANFRKEYPHFDVISMNISSCYDCESKIFYNHVSGIIGNSAGDFFWDSEYSLEILRTRGILEEDIPNFLKNHLEIEKRVLDGKSYNDLL